MKRIILFLIRKKLGVKKYEYFRFFNQKTNDIYYFNEQGLRKILSNGVHERSGVSLNWILDNECKILLLPLNIIME